MSQNQAAQTLAKSSQKNLTGDSLVALNKPSGEPTEGVETTPPQGGSSKGLGGEGGGRGSSNGELAPGVTDQRRYPRRAYNRPVGVLCRGEYNIVYGVDLGEGGVAFHSDLVYTQGHKIVLSFQIPGGAFVVVIAQVLGVRKDATGQLVHGCAFLNLRFENRREIRSFVSAR